MSFYEQLIIKFTGCDIVDAPVLEELMRIQHNGVLDGLSENCFRQSAILAMKNLRLLRDENPDWSPFSSECT